MRQSRFTDFFIRENRLDEQGFEAWAICPDMLFNAEDKWWGDRGRRDRPHEGLDLVLYRNRQERILRLGEETKIPVMYDGLVVNVIDDFLGKTLFIEHDLADGSDSRVYTIYGHTNPERIIDVGAAEGYYAVGLSWKCKSAIVYSFDVDLIARQRQKQLADINGVTNLIVGKLCSHATLTELLTNKSLLVCDIEGEEHELLDPTKVPALHHADVLVEVHPFKSKTVDEVFSVPGISIPGKFLAVISSSYRAGNVVASLPEGFTFPEIISAIAFPPSTPGCHASKIASASSLHSITSITPPIFNTTATFLFLA